MANPALKNAVLAILLVSLAAADSLRAEAPTVAQARDQRKEAANRKRRLVFHSDGVAMDPKYAYHEPTPSVIPHLPGTQTDACTYSLIHQFPVVRLYRTKAGDEWPVGIAQKLFGDGPDGLDQYIKFCHDNKYEAFWAMRTNDTHDAANDAHGHERWNSNHWKQSHADWLMGTREKLPPFGGWSAFDYAQPDVREKVFSLVEEVCQNYPVDGVMLDFFRHLPTFKSTAWGAKQASDEECEELTTLMRRLRDVRDKVGAEKGRPVILAVRTPDSPEYSRALGIDIERWMSEGLIDIWVTPGYFRLQEWDDIVKYGHGHSIPVWAAIDDSRVMGRDNRNSVEAFRGRIMNASRAGADSIWIFNYFHFPKDPEFQLLNEAGDLNTLAFTNKVYTPDDLGQDMAWRYLANGSSYYKRAKPFDPQVPEKLKVGGKRQIELRVGDDVAKAVSSGQSVDAALKLQTDHPPQDLKLTLNGASLKQTGQHDGWLDFSVEPSQLKLGVNQIVISRGETTSTDAVLKDLQLAINYRYSAGPAK